MSDQTIEFTRMPDGTRLAYSWSGAGLPLVKTANWLTHLEYDRENPVWRHWIDYFSARFRLLRYDERGNGLSDRSCDALDFGHWVSDLEHLVDHLGLERFSLLGISQGGAVALEYAARHPERVERIVLCGAFAQGWARRGTAEERRRGRALQELVATGWGDDNPAYREFFASIFAPDATPEEVKTFSELQRMCSDPETAARLIASSGDIDISERLALVKAPALVAHARGDARVPFEQGRALAAGIPGAKFLPLDSNNHALMKHEPAWQVFCESCMEFLAPPPAAESIPATVESVAGALTPREIDVVRCVARGLDNAAVASCLGITDKTVRNYLTRIYDKLGVSGRAQLIVRFREPPPPTV